MERIIDVYYDEHGLPFKDEQCTVHFPCVGSEFLGASQTTTIRFHYSNIGNDSNVYTVESKRPDGKTGSQLLSVDSTNHYAEMSLSGWYSACKGDLFLSLKVYQGGSTATYDETAQMWVVSGVPVIQSTGAIKLAINYTPVGRYEDYDDAVETFQQVLGALGDKISISDSIVVVNQLSDVVIGNYDDGQLFYDISKKNVYKLSSGAFIKLNNKLEIVDVSGYEYEELFAMFGTQQFMSYFEETTNIAIYQFKQSGDNYALYVWTYKNGCLYMPYVDMSAIFSINDFTNLEYEKAPVITISSAYSTLSDLDYEKVLQPNATISYNNKIYTKNNEDEDFVYFTNVDIDIDITQGRISIRKGVLTLTKNTKLLSYSLKGDSYYNTSEIGRLLGTKQNKLYSGANIKTINNISLLGSGNIEIQGGSGNAEWGSIGGNIADQTDLQNEFQNVREVAEGKCKTYVINASTETVNSDFYDRYSRFVGEEIIPFESKQEMDDWLSEERRAVINPVFASQDDVITLQIAGTNQNANYFDYFVVSSQNISPYPTTREFILITLSDIIYEQVAFKLGDNLYIISLEYPDRWVSLVYKTSYPGTGIIPGGVRFHALETSKVNLDNYSTKTETSTEVNKVAHDIAVEYDESTLYGIGDLCIKDKLLYKCNTNNTTGTWDSTKWNLTTVNSELGIIKGDYAKLDENNTFSGQQNRFTNGIESGIENDLTKYYKHAIVDRKFVGSSLINAIYNFPKSENGTFTIATADQINYVVLKDHAQFGALTGDEAYKMRNGGFVPTFAPINGNQRQGIFLQLSYISGTSYKATGWFLDTSRNLYLFEGQIGNVSEGSTTNVSYSNFVEKKVVDLATTDQAFNVINASDIVNNTLTQAQFDLITNGKPTRIVGTIKLSNNDYKDITIINGNIFNNSFWFLGISTRNRYIYINYFSIDGNSKLLTLRDNIPAIGLHGIDSINSIIINQYYKKPQSSVSLTDGGTITDNTLKTLIQNEQPIKLNGFTCYFSCDDGTNYQYKYSTYDTTNNVNTTNLIIINKTTWVATFHITNEWYGTQAEYDALGTYDSNTIYNILES